MAMVDRLGGNWVIVRGDGMPAPGQTANSPEAQETESSLNREFWTGDGWTGQYGFARQFAHREEAETYLAQHRHRMAQLSCGSWRGEPYRRPGWAWRCGHRPVNSDTVSGTVVFQRRVRVTVHSTCTVNPPITRDCYAFHAVN
jgi:hypothetical protein